jgi:hypothetical protein
MRTVSVILISLLVLFPSFITPATTEPLDTRTLNRPLAPVVVAGDKLPGLAGAPLNQLFVYAYTRGVWSQIPWQFDEFADGKLVSSEDGLLDDDDELVLMADDASDRAPADAWIVDAESQTHDRCEIAITDPLDPAGQAWVYVFRSTTLSETVAADYASYDADQLLITGRQYVLGLVSGKMIADRLELNGSGIDILDRTKARVNVPFVGVLTEEQMADMPAPVARRDGRVRAVVVVEATDGTVPVYFMGYRSFFRYSVEYDLSAMPVSPTWMRLSADLNANAIGSTYYGRNNPAGVPIDGVADSVPETPASDWVQASGSTGSFVQLVDWTGMSGTAKTYYKDNADVDNSDTGDKKSYGDAGIRIDNPGKRLHATVWTCILPPDQPNVGESIRSGVLNPPAAQGAAQAYQPAVVTRYIHLPLLLRNR